MDHNDKTCDMCEGTGEVDAFVFGNGQTSQSVGCPQCVERDRDEEIAELKSKISSAQGNNESQAILQRIRMVIARHLSPVGSSKHEAISEIAGILAGPQTSGLYFDLVTHLYRQKAFSEKTFGPGARTAGVLDHIRKELVEIERDPADVTEWADLILLALDGAWRAGHTPEEIAAAVNGKQGVNERRSWPDWRTADPGKAIEHLPEAHA